jgi:hypothetical protein
LRAASDARVPSAGNRSLRVRCNSSRRAETYSSTGVVLRTAMEKSQYEHRRAQNGT